MSFPVAPSSQARLFVLASLICLLIYGHVSYQSTQALHRPGVVVASSLGSSRSNINWYRRTKFFVSAATNDTLRRYDSLPIENFCSNRSWNSSTAVNCDASSGGIGNVRQQILNCVHHAILEGNGLIIPSIELRSSENLSMLRDGSTSFDYLFNLELFKSRLGAACPRMIIYNSIEDAELKGVAVSHYPPTLTKILICDESPDFAVNFGLILPFPMKIYRLAFTALFNLSKKYHISISPNLTSSPPSTYLGIHLRTAKDAVEHGDFSPYEFQRDFYLSTAYTLNLPVVYAASGNMTSVGMFADWSRYFMPHLRVVTKENLLFGPDLQELRSLTWDQAALVDYLLLERASFFTGMKESSFSWNVMLIRAAVRGGIDAVCGPRQRLGEHEVWRDPWTVICGDFPSGVDHEDIKTWP